MAKENRKFVIIPLDEVEDVMWQLNANTPDF